MKSVDFGLMQKSLSLAWLARLWVKSDWGSVISHELRRYVGFQFLIRCNYDHKCYK